MNNTDTSVEITESTSDTQLRDLLSGKTPEVETPSEEPVKAAEEPKETDSSSAKVEETDSENPEAASETAKEKQEPDTDKQLTKGIQKRFKDLTGKIRELEQQLASKPAAIEKPGTANPAPDPSAPVMPQLETFAGTYAEYQQALGKYVNDLTDYKLSQADKQRQAATERQSAEERQRTTAAAWKKAEESVASKYADYEDVAESVKLPATASAPYLAQAIQASQIGPEILYHLGTKPEEVARLAALPPVQAVMELGKLEASLSTPKPVAVAKPLPKPPAIPTAGSVAHGVDLNDPKLSQDAFNREVKKLLKRK